MAWLIDWSVSKRVIVTNLKAIYCFCKHSFFWRRLLRFNSKYKLQFLSVRLENSKHETLKQTQLHLLCKLLSKSSIFCDREKNPCRAEHREEQKRERERKQRRNYAIDSVLIQSAKTYNNIKYSTEVIVYLCRCQRANNFNEKARQKKHINRPNFSFS